MTSPTESYGVPLVIDFTRDSVRVCVAVAVAVSSFDVVPLAEAVATFTTEPAFRSAWVTVYEAVHVIASPGSRLPSRFPTVVTAGQLSFVVLLSATVTGPARLMLPVLVTRK